MTKKVFTRLNFSFLDLIPAISGLIGKIALVSSFAFVWAQALNITNPNFVFENVRIELIIGSIITLIATIICPHIAPAGTLAPLIVMIPTMATFGVHPFILSLMVGFFGIISVKTKMFEKLILLSGSISKTSLTLVFGISGIFLAIQKLVKFFSGNLIPFLLLMLLLTLFYGVLLRYKKNWLIIPIAAVVSILLPLLFGIALDVNSAVSPLNFNPFYWWNDMWGIGFGFDIMTIIRTLPFALFVVLLWAVDTVSITALIDAEYKAGEKREEIDVNSSFLVVSVRNIIGGICGGAQTGSLWRSFLIPLFMVKRPIRSSAVLLGILGIVAGITATPIKVLSFPPLIWTVLLFGVFLPFLIVGIKNVTKTDGLTQKTAILFFTGLGVIVSPILTWICSVCFEKFLKIVQVRKAGLNS